MYSNVNTDHVLVSHLGLLARINVVSGGILVLPENKVLKFMIVADSVITV